MSLELGRVKDIKNYAVNLAARATGFEIFKMIREDTRFKNAWSGKPPSLVQSLKVNASNLGISALGLAFPGFINYAAYINRGFWCIPEEERKQSDQLRINLLMTSFITDIVSLAGLPLASLALSNPLPLALRPVLIGAEIAAMDALTVRKIRGNLSEATPGTYEDLEEKYRQYYDPKHRMGIIRNPDGSVAATITDESFCLLGGVCKELAVKNEDTGDFVVTHVTEVNQIADPGADDKAKRTSQIIERFRRNVASAQAYS